MTNSIKNIGALLGNSDKSFQDIIKKVRMLEDLNQRFWHFLDPELRPHCLIANFREGCLIISVKSAVWSTRLRYQIPELLQKMRTEGKLPALASIHCIVSPSEVNLKEQTPPGLKPLPISPASAALLMNTAKFIEDKGLARALKKLSKHARGETKG